MEAILAGVWESCSYKTLPVETSTAIACLAATEKSSASTGVMPRKRVNIVSSVKNNLRIMNLLTSFLYHYITRIVRKNLKIYRKRLENTENSVFCKIIKKKDVI